ncbi:hypothetical protein A4A49_24447 [Nicotiana attenuata]|uniref:Uncharacterized protein n=1 Tax=Nicotiana attenuata TaxID=49451 RepID=A0A314KPV0_NICAT|nr:hypothetical protein A4A49_24447 [Nicotiana attenuata]
MDLHGTKSRIIDLRQLLLEKRWRMTTDATGSDFETEHTGILEATAVGDDLTDASGQLEVGKKIEGVGLEKKKQAGDNKKLKDINETIVFAGDKLVDEILVDHQLLQIEAGKQSVNFKNGKLLNRAAYGTPVGETSMMDKQQGMSIGDTAVPVNSNGTVHAAGNTAANVTENSKGTVPRKDNTAALNLNREGILNKANAAGVKDLVEKPAGATAVHDEGQGTDVSGANAVHVRTALEKAEQANKFAAGIEQATSAALTSTGTMTTKVDLDTPKAGLSLAKGAGQARKSATNTSNYATKSKDWTVMNRTPTKIKSPGLHNQILSSTTIGVSNSIDALVNEHEQDTKEAGNTTQQIGDEARPITGKTNSSGNGVQQQTSNERAARVHVLTEIVSVDNLNIQMTGEEEKLTGTRELTWKNRRGLGRRLTQQCLGLFYGRSSTELLDLGKSVFLNLF